MSGYGDADAASALQVVREVFEELLEVLAVAMNLIVEELLDVAVADRRLFVNVFVLHEHIGVVGLEVNSSMVISSSRNRKGP